MTLDDIEYLVAVAEHRHLGRAAEALGLTQPALTRAVARLEALAGQRLFTRHPKGMEPTPAGAAFLRHARRMKQDYADALQELQLIKTGQLGLLRVGYSPAADEDLLMRLLRRLLVERPAAQLQLGHYMAQDVMKLLGRGALDLAVCPVPEPLAPEFAVTPLNRERQNVVADREHPLFTRGPLTLADLAGESWGLPVPGARLRAEIEQALRAAGCPPPQVRLESLNLTLGHFELLRGTRLLSLCTDGWLPRIRRIGLEILPLDSQLPLRQLAVIRRADAPRSPLAERLTELLQEAVQGVAAPA